MYPFRSHLLIDILSPTRRASYFTLLFDAGNPQFEWFLQSNFFWRDQDDTNSCSLAVRCSIYIYLPRVFSGFPQFTSFRLQDSRTFGGEFHNKVCQDLTFNRSSGLILNIKGSQRGSPLVILPEKSNLLRNACKGCLIKMITMWAWK